MKLIRLIKQDLVLLLFLVATPALHAAPDIKAYAELPVVSMMAISPNGERIAFRKRDGERDLVVVFSLRDNKSISVASLAGKTPSQLYFVNNDQVIVKAGKVRKITGYKGRHHITTAYVLDIKTNGIRQVLYPGKGVDMAQTGLGDIVGISTDGQYAYMPAFVTEESYDNNKTNYSLVRASLQSKLSPRVVRKGDANSNDYFVDANGQVIVEEKYGNRFDKHQIFARQGKEWVEIYSLKTNRRVIIPVGLHPDHGSLVILAESDETGYQSYFTMSLKNGGLQGPVFGREGADVERALTDINRVVYGVQYSGFYPSYEFFDKSLDERIAKILAQFRDQSVWLSDWTSDWKSIVVYVEGPNSPGDFYLMRDKQKPRFLATSRPNISVNDINPIATYKYKARDGLMIPTILTIPLSKVADMKNLPTIMLPHGGPQSYDRIRFDWLAQAFASQGYLVIQPQFRGSAGFGGNHTRAGWGEWGKKMQDDLTDAIKSLAKKGMVDERKVCIAGISYGGYAALAGGAFSPELYKCIVAINGVSDLPLMMQHEKSEHGRHHWVLSYWRDVMADGKKEKSILQDSSPAYYAEKFSAPVLLLHGKEDKVVRIKQSEIMYKKLKKANKSVILKKLKGEDHHLSKPETRLQALSMAIEFVNREINK